MACRLAPRSRIRTVLSLFFPLTLLVLTTLGRPAGATGLWVGNVEVRAISEVNKPASDLGFDLRLEGLATVVGDDGSDEVETTVLVSHRSGDWRYLDNGDLLPDVWREPTYAEPGWRTGTAEFGFGDGGETTTLEAGPSPDEKHPIYYFRKTFGVVDPAAFEEVVLYLQRDDGAVVYLNGQEVLRSNMPAGPIGPLTSAVEGVASDDEGRFFEHSITTDAMVVGTNVVAVEIHQHAAELRPFDGTAAPSATASSATLRLILHQDSGGDVRMLKSVIQMWQDGTLNADGTLATPGRYVLITRDELIPQYRGVASRDGSMVGRRVSTVGYDFQGNQKELEGTLDAGGSLTATLVVPPNHPTHPFRHRYHPDHDNMDAIYEGPADEVGAIERTITLELSDRYPPDPDQPEASPPPGWGSIRLGGLYRETIRGLHRDDIEVRGSFTLDRVTETETLDD